MGKKKVAKQSIEEVLKEGAVVESAATKASTAKSSKKKYENGRVYIKSSYNNTFITVTDDKGGVIAWASAGALGFAGPKKATPFAASKVINALSEKLSKTGPVNIKILVNGVGGGRDSAIRSLINHSFNVMSIQDITPIPHNGPRPKKIRRV